MKEIKMTINVLVKHTQVGYDKDVNVSAFDPVTGRTVQLGVLEGGQEHIYAIYKEQSIVLAEKSRES